MRPDVDKVDLYSIRELSPADSLVPDEAWLAALCNPATGISYKASLTLLGNIISNMIGSGIVLPDRVYRIGVSIPPGATIGTYVDTDGLTKGYINDPYLDGKVYSINRRGVELMVKGVEWDNDQADKQVRLLKVNSTGAGDVFSDGEIIIIQFQPQISPIIVAPDAIGRFSSGVLPVSGDTTLTASSHRKIIYITTPGIITLSSTFPENVVCCLVHNTATDGQSTIIAPSGQAITFNGSTVPGIWLGRNERIEFVRVGSTWYMISPYPQYERVGTIVAGRLKGPNQIIAQGQTVLRSDYPRLVDYLNRLNAAYPGVVLNAASWSSAKTYWGWGNGTTTIQVPDLRGYFPRWLDLGAGVDEDRVTSGLHNKPGSPEGEMLKKHTHTWLSPVSNDSLGGSVYVTSSNGLGGPGTTTLNTTITETGGKETRPINAGELPLIYV